MHHAPATTTGTTTEQRCRGFSLIESLIALVIVGGLLYVAMAMALQERKVGRRVNAQVAAVAAIQATIEAVRAGALPLENAVVTSPWPPPTDSEVDSMLLFIDIEPEFINIEEPLRGLFRLRVEARYLQFGSVERQSIETLHWRHR